MYTTEGSRLVYALLDTRSKESLIYKKLYHDFGLSGVPLQVLLITVNGSRSLVSTYNPSFKIGPLDNFHVNFKMCEESVMDDLPSIDKNYPISNNLYSPKNAEDLIKGNKFLNLSDSNLPIIIGICEASLINFEKIRKPSNLNEPFVGHCKLGWTVLEPDPQLKSKSMTS